ncbi:hypothetical protein [Pseudanabaena sp. lw0831]|uniref:hypothetical protein n=1 Tax=Pseudanabaena sp. lw0831 TaxID=1357935 RepID=UPI00191644CF|nr:hypothetical protein [Pseudanabaena sp. lw0831]
MIAVLLLANSDRLVMWLFALRSLISMLQIFPKINIQNIVNIVAKLPFIRKAEGVTLSKIPNKLRSSSRVKLKVF